MEKEEAITEDPEEEPINEDPITDDHKENPITEDPKDKSPTKDPKGLRTFSLRILRKTSSLSVASGPSLTLRTLILAFW